MRRCSFHGRIALLVISFFASLIYADVQRIELLNGDIYEGELKDGVRTGRGRLERPSGAWYEGDFLNGRIHGNGSYTWADGRIYQGTFQNDSNTVRGLFDGRAEAPMLATSLKTDARVKVVSSRPAKTCMKGTS